MLNIVGFVVVIALLIFIIMRQKTTDVSIKSNAHKLQISPKNLSTILNNFEGGQFFQHDSFNPEHHKEKIGQITDIELHLGKDDHFLTIRCPWEAEMKDGQWTLSPFCQQYPDRVFDINFYFIENNAIFLLENGEVLLVSQNLQGYVLLTPKNLPPAVTYVNLQ